MTTWGNFEFEDLKRLAKTFKKALDDRVIERFIREFLLEMAFRSIRRIKKRTPVDTGELRNTWFVGRVERRGTAYTVEVFNNTKYAIFVEYGHRSGRETVRWINGKFMMTISMKEIERQLPAYLEKRQTQLLNDLMNGRSPRRGG